MTRQAHASPNPAGRTASHAIGAKTAPARMLYAMPDVVLGQDRGRYAGRYAVLGAVICDRHADHDLGQASQSNAPGTKPFGF